MAFTVNDDALAKLDSLDDAGKRAVLEKLSGDERAQVVAALPAYRAKRTEAKPQAKPTVHASVLEAIASGAGQSALGLGDELGATFQALGTAALGGKTPRDVLDAYRQSRSENRQVDQAAREEHPLAYYSGMGAGMLGTAPLMPALSVAKGAPALTRIGASALSGLGQGGLAGAGASEADLTRGDVGRFAKDVGISGGVGGVTGGVLGAAGAGLSALRGRAAQGIDDAVAAEQAIQQRLAEKNIASAQGSYRSAIQSASRDIEVLERAAQRPDDVGAKARAWLESPEAEAVYAKVALSKLGTAPERVAEMGAAKAKLGELVAGKEEAVAAQTGEALRDPVRKHVLPRVLTLGHRLLPPALAAAGGAIGGTEGAIAGGIVGGIMSLTQGLPGRILKNLATKPAVRQAFWEKVLSASGGKSAENVAMVNALEAAAQKGPGAFTAALNELGVPLTEKGAEPPRDRARAMRDALEQQ